MNSKTGDAKFVDKSSTIYTVNLKGSGPFAFSS